LYAAATAEDGIFLSGCGATPPLPLPDGSVKTATNKTTHSARHITRSMRGTGDPVFSILKLSLSFIDVFTPAVTAKKRNRRAGIPTRRHTLMLLFQFC
jgi:hypothetical protein